MHDDTVPLSATLCPFCGEPEQVELFEVWSDHNFTIECCCEGRFQVVTREMADDPAWARSFLQSLGVEEAIGHRLRRLADDGCCGMVLDWQLNLRDVTFAVARRFVRLHHRHCRPPVAWRFGKSVWNGPTMIGVFMAGNPVAPGLCGRNTLEVNRLCVRRDVPRALAWNGASKLLASAAREAERRGWSHIVTYTRSDESGVSLRASGWTQEAVVRGRGWHSGRRRRSNRNGFIDKVRWGKALRPRRLVPQQATERATPPSHESIFRHALFAHSQRPLDPADLVG